MNIPGYEILEEIGKGGFGEVYKARHIVTGEIRAIKIAFPNTAEFLRNEANLEEILEYPTIVKNFEYNLSADRPYIVREYIDGESLQQKMKRVGKFKIEKALEITENVLEAIAYAHSKGVIHRDINPSNILIDKQGDVKITDFGLGKAIQKAKTQVYVKKQEAQHYGKKQGTQQFAGTIAYMAPEQRDGKPATEKSDMWSIGAVLYRMITNRAPGGLDDIMELNPRITSELKELLKKSLTTEPSERYDNAHVFLGDVYCTLKNYEKAEQKFEDFPFPSETHFPQQHIEPKIKASHEQQRRRLERRDAWMNFSSSVRRAGDSVMEGALVGAHGFLKYVLPIALVGTMAYCGIRGCDSLPKSLNFSNKSNIVSQQENYATYTIKKGDTLSEISRNSLVSLDSILEANPEIKDPNKIEVGQKIKVPRTSSSNYRDPRVETKTETAPAVEKKDESQKYTYGMPIKLEEIRNLTPYKNLESVNAVPKDLDLDGKSEIFVIGKSPGVEYSVSDFHIFLLEQKNNKWNFKSLETIKSLEGVCGNPYIYNLGNDVKKEVSVLVSGEGEYTHKIFGYIGNDFKKIGQTNYLFGLDDNPVIEIIGSDNDRQFSIRYNKQGDDGRLKIFKDTYKLKEDRVTFLQQKIYDWEEAFSSH